MTISRPVFAAILLAWGCAAYADEKGCDVHGEKEAQLCGYEPTTIGYTKDSDDVGFMDFKISVRYQLFPESITKGLNYIADDLGNKYSLYIAFTGRFGQYIGTRDSAPVIGKRFNPKAFLRRWTDMAERDLEKRGYLDLGYGHESNGQSVTTAGQYAQAQAAAERPEFANDQLSRGWDYLELVWKKAKYSAVDGLSSYVTLKYFLENGLLQGAPEEYNGLENSPQGKPRSQVNGVAGLLKYSRETEKLWVLEDFKAAAGYETGYHRMSRYNTWRLELGTKVVQLPVNFWYQTGYGSDLAQYYKKVSSKGIEVQIGSF
jgi:hypothetical protein